jgi:hypothetical protein
LRRLLLPSTMAPVRALLLAPLAQRVLAPALLALLVRVSLGQLVRLARIQVRWVLRVMKAPPAPLALLVRLAFLVRLVPAVLWARLVRRLAPRVRLEPPARIQARLARPASVAIRALKVRLAPLA